MRLFKLTLIALLLPLTMMAQKSEVGIFAGLQTYQGDLVSPGFSLKTAILILDFLYKHHLSTKLAIRGGLNIGKLTGDDADFDDNANRGFSFESNTFSLGAGLEYTFLAKDRYDAGGSFQKTVSPYAFLMLGITNSSVTVPDNIVRTQAEIDGDGVAFGIPIGLGVKFDLSEKFTLGLEGATNLIFTDYLDGFSESANPDKNDAYFTAGVSLTYRMGEGSDNSAGNNN